MLSIVIPIHNEEPSILRLYDRLAAVLDALERPYEILFVDDASTDRSFDLLANLVETDARLKVIRLRRNFGQTAALAAGFDESQGNIVISLDKQRLTVYSGTEAIAHTRVSTGTAGHPTPAGVFSVIQKDRWHRSNIYDNAPMFYMQRKMTNEKWKMENGK